jgi:fatty acyl-CoA reductase
MVVGDLTIKNLGLSDEHRNMVTNNVNIIINSAASVKFDDKLLVAIEINYFGA